MDNMIRAHIPTHLRSWRGFQNHANEFSLREATQNCLEDEIFRFVLYWHDSRHFVTYSEGIMENGLKGLKLRWEPLRSAKIEYRVAEGEQTETVMVGEEEGADYERFE